MGATRESSCASGIFGAASWAAAVPPPGTTGTSPPGASRAAQSRATAVRVRPQAGRTVRIDTFPLLSFSYLAVERLEEESNPRLDLVLVERKVVDDRALVLERDHDLLRDHLADHEVEGDEPRLLSPVVACLRGEREEPRPRQNQVHPRL